jgi:hypothetical protein
MSITDTERQQIKDWILASLPKDRTVILKMQDESFDSPTISNRYKGATSNGIETSVGNFQQQVLVFKSYLAVHGGGQTFSQILERGGLFEGNRTEDQEKLQRLRTHNFQLFAPRIAAVGAAVEASTGFFGLTEEEYEGLTQEVKMPYDSYSNPNVTGEYKTIYDARPLAALKNCSYAEFMAIRTETLAEQGLLISHNKGEQSALAAPMPPPSAPAGTHASKFATPGAAWTDDAKARDAQSTLLNQLQSGLNLAAQQAAATQASIAEIGDLIQTLHGKQQALQARQTAQQTMLGDLQQQIAAALGSGRG